MSIFGAEVAIIYVIVGLILAVLGGTLLSKLNMDRYVADFIRNAPKIETAEADTLTRKDRLDFAYGEMKGTVKKVFWYVIIGVGIGALIHNIIPQSVIDLVLGTDNILSVPIATAVGIPMYADIFGTIPIAEALFAKGVGLGTILAFMMSVTALSMPSIIMLKRVVKTPLLVSFVSIVTVGILFIGYFFNYIVVL